MTSELPPEDRELYRIIAWQLTDASNYPEGLMAPVLCTDMRPVIDAVFSALKREGYKKCEVASPPGTV